MKNIKRIISFVIIVLFVVFLSWFLNRDTPRPFWEKECTFKAYYEDGTIEYEILAYVSDNHMEHRTGAGTKSTCNPTETSDTLYFNWDATSVLQENFCRRAILGYTVYSANGDIETKKEIRSFNEERDGEKYNGKRGYLEFYKKNGIKYEWVTEDILFWHDGSNYTPEFTTWNRYVYYPTGQLQSESVVITSLLYYDISPWDAGVHNNGCHSESAIPNGGCELDGVVLFKTEYIDLSKRLGYESFFHDGSFKGDNSNLIVSSSGYYNKNEIKKNKKIGEWRYFYPNGKLGKSLNYNNNGERDGTYIEYFSTGNKNIEGQFIRDKKDGLWKYYYNNGDLDYTEYFINGHINK